MGLFTKNTLTIDETVDVVTFIVAGSMYSYATYGSTLSATLRKEMCDQRVELRGKQACLERGHIGRGTNDGADGKNDPEAV